MLKPAILFKRQLNRAIAESAFDKRYKFYHLGYADLQFKAEDSTWSKIQMCSVDKENSLIGFMMASIARPENFIKTFDIINFCPDKKYTFGKDVFTFMDMLLNKMNFYKVCFSVVVGNPIEATYDKLVKKYGGRVVGVFEKNTILMDNKLYDVKFYEIMSCKV